MSSSSIPATLPGRLARLNELLQAIKPGEFESLAAALVSKVLDVGIAVAKSGFQHGGDAGSAGRQGRRFRIETKRYAETTSLSDRELLGEIDHALTRDPALEAWFLAATRGAPEQLELDLLAKSDQLGLPIMVVDWKPDGFPALAALCTAGPELVEDMVGKEAGDLARALAADGADSLARLKREMESWNLGYERLRARSHDQLRKLWTDRRMAFATLGQDVAGGAAPTTITRTALNNALDAWWTGAATKDAPALVLGNEGAGKTWATVHWLIDRADDQPLVLVVPSGAAASLADTSLAGVKRFIGDRLHEVTGSRDQAHWRLRFGRLLLRPEGEGPVLTLVFDGLNQEPSVRWTDLLKTLQHPEFAGRVRTMAVSRNLHFSERLKCLQGLVVPPHQIEVGPYDDSPGGELDQRLALEGLNRDDLHPDIVEIARTPRLFSLVVRLRDRLVDGGQVTIHRLLWEYGRDTLGVRDRSLSEQEWRTWLGDVARDRRQGIRDYSLGSIGSMVERPDLDQNDVFRRLSDIVDGRFAAGGAAGALTLSPTIVAHALGAALLEHLRGIEATAGVDALESAVTDWIDPIAGIDERAEILRASVSILLEGDPAGQRTVLSLLVREWLRSQNLPETHRGEVVRLAPVLCEPLLDVVEQTWGGARNLALDALRRMPREDLIRRDLIIARCTVWLRTLSRDVDPPARRHDDAERSRSARLIERVGADADGERVILGERLSFVERIDHDAHAAIPTLLEGYALASALPVFSAAAISLAIRGRDNFWAGLKWLCLLNAIDADETTGALQTHAAAVQARPPEAGVNPKLPGRIAALLMWLSGDEDIEALAAVTDTGLGRSLAYETDYLADPGRSFFVLERRHAEDVLRDTTLPLGRRLSRVSGFPVDPAFQLPPEFVSELREALADYDMSAVDATFGSSVEDSNWETLAPVLARGAPDLLASLVRRKLEGLVSREGDRRRIGLARSERDFLLSDQLTSEALAALAEPPAEAEVGDGAEIRFARSRALLIDAYARPAAERISFLLDRHVDLYTDIAYVLSPVSPLEVDALVARYGETEKAADLVRILSFVDAAPGVGSWAWFLTKALDPDFAASGVANQLLWAADRERFGRDLLARSWSWGQGRHVWNNHYGSLALAAAGISLPFEQTVVAIAPWLVPHAVVLRGGDAADAAMAAELLDGILSLDGRSAPDLGSDVTISQPVRSSDPEAFSLTIREPDRGNPIANLRAALDETGRSEARSRAVPTALERLREARVEGASLFMHDFHAEDLEPIVRHAPSRVQQWLEGFEQPALDFRRRVHLAEGFYIALCEALLTVRPAEGERLWRALRAVSHIRFIGEGEVEQLTLMLYRVASTPDGLRREQLDPSLSRTDRSLFEVALASRLGVNPGWLDGFIEAEAASADTWRRQRARKLRGFHGGDGPNQDWPIGPSESLRETRERDANDWRRREVCARHWWDRYWAAESDEEAYAAWVLLLQTVDRRAHAWLQAPECIEERRMRRVAHFSLNRDELVRAMKKAEKKLGDEYLGRSTFEGVWPWNGTRR